VILSVVKRVYNESSQPEGDGSSELGASALLDEGSGRCAYIPASLSVINYAGGACGFRCRIATLRFIVRLNYGKTTHQ